MEYLFFFILLWMRTKISRVVNFKLPMKINLIAEKRAVMGVDIEVISPGDGM